MTQAGPNSPHWRVIGRRRGSLRGWGGHDRQPYASLRCCHEERAVRGAPDGDHTMCFCRPAVSA